MYEEDYRRSVRETIHILQEYVSPEMEVNNRYRSI